MLDVISFVVFIIILSIFVIKERKKVKREGIVLMRRTDKGKKWIDDVAKKHPKFWNAIAVAGVISAVPAIVFGVWFLGSNLFNIFTGVSVEGVRLVLPWPTAETQLQPGLLLLPWWFWVIGVMSVIVPHELMHGIVCRLEKVKVKSLGWLLLLFIPGAFVEPDEKQLEKESRLTKLKVYAAGSFANFVIAGAVLIISNVVIFILFQIFGNDVITVFFYKMFFWIFILNIGIGIVNMLPIKPLDGGHVFENLINRWTGKYTKVIVRVVSVAALLLLILNLVGPLMV